MRTILATTVTLLLVTAANADLVPYSQDFEGLDMASPTALGDDGWLVYGNAFDSVGNFLYNYGPFPAPNGTSGFSAVATGDAGPDQGTLYLNVYNDYKNADHLNGITIEANVFQEQIIGAGDLSKTFTFDFDYKASTDFTPRGSTTTFAFIKVLDPSNGFALVAYPSLETTGASPDTWSEGNSLSVMIDAGWEGHLLQFGFLSNATLFEPSGIFYDNVSFAPLALGACCVSAACTVETEDDCLALGGAYLGDGTECELFLESLPNVPIPDGDPVGVTDVISVGTDFVIGDLDVDLVIDHTFVGDLCITLEHDGQTVQLVARSGADTGETCHFEDPFGCAEDNYDLILDDEGTGGAIEDLCSTTMTSRPNYTPFEPLSAFDGMNATGPWTMTVSDNAGLDTGTLLGWSLHLSACPPPCPADFDGSGDVGFSDLTRLLSAWGPCAAPCPEDLDGSGAVGFTDLTALLAAWGPCST